MGGASITAAALPSLLTLCKRVADAGGDLTAATFSTALTFSADRAGEGLPLLLDFHRVAAEFALPSAHHAQFLADTPTRLTVFLKAKKRSHPRPFGFADEWERAADATDFARMRFLLSL